MDSNPPPMQPFYTLQNFDRSVSASLFIVVLNKPSMHICQLYINRLRESECQRLPMYPAGVSFGSLAAHCTRLLEKNVIGLDSSGQMWAQRLCTKAEARSRQGHKPMTARPLACLFRNRCNPRRVQGPRQLDLAAALKQSN